jgi:hypothetical protein
VLLNNTLG